MWKMYCDLCGEPLLNIEKSRSFKIKELKFSWHESWWQRIDTHEECIKKLFDSLNGNNESIKT